MPIETKEFALQQEILAKVTTLESDTKTIKGDMSEIKDDIHEMKREVYPRLSALEKHQAVVEERERHRSGGEGRATSNRDKVVIALLVAGLIGAFGIIWNVRPSEPAHYPDTRGGR